MQLIERLRFSCRCNSYTTLCDLNDPRMIAVRGGLLTRIGASVGPNCRLCNAVYGRGLRLGELVGPHVSKNIKMSSSTKSKPTDGELVEAAVLKLGAEALSYRIVDIGINLADSAYDKVAIPIRLCHRPAPGHIKIVE